MIKLILSFVITFISFFLQAALPKPDTLNLSLKKGGHQVTLQAKSIPFNENKHSGEKDFIGTDGGKPSTEFEFIKVTLDGKEIPISKKMK